MENKLGRKDLSAMEFGNEPVGTYQVAITESDIENVIVGGFEGGCNYWMGIDKVNHTDLWGDKPKDVPNSLWATKLLIEGKTIHFYDIEDESEKFTLDINKLLEGIRRNSLERPFDSNIEDGDAETYDCIIQYAMLGDIVYG